MGIAAIYVLLIFALSFFIELGRKSKLYNKRKAFLKALIVSTLTTATPLIIILAFLLITSNSYTVFSFFFDHLTITIALIIFMPLAAYFSFHRLIS